MSDKIQMGICVVLWVWGWFNILFVALMALINKDRRDNDIY